MTLLGHVRNGVVVLQDGNGLPEGTKVVVRALPAKTQNPKGKSRARKARRALLKHAGKVTDLPSDAARNVDHYLYGHAKQ